MKYTKLSISNPEELIFGDALMMCDMKTFIFSQAVLGVRDMQFMWSRICDIAKKNQVIAGGDTVCG